MKNPRITKKERGLIKGSLRRVFSRSELRQQVLISAIIKHSDPKRKAVKTWVRCAECGKPEAKSNVVVDHILPVVPIDTSYENMSFDQLIDNLWCDPKNLQVLDLACHKIKSKAENKLRREYKKRSKVV